MKLKLHEAMAVVLLNIKNRTATTTEIANEINRRKLYTKKDNSVLEAGQVKMRATLSNGQYAHLYAWIEPNSIKLK